MTENQEKLNVMYYQLVLSMQASAMQHMGKVVSPATGKIERNLEAARYSIDMLEMLQVKMKGNLTDDESKLLEHTLYQLRLNYVDEAKKGEAADPVEESPEGAGVDAEKPSKEAPNDNETGASDSDFESS